MKHLTPEEIELAFMPKATPTFAEVIVRLETETKLSDTRKRDLISGLRRVAKALNRPPEAVPCDAAWLQPRIARISPASLQLSVKTWQNLVSNARAAMAHVGMIEPRLRKMTDLMPEWQSLWRLLLDANDMGGKTGLRRFIHFLSNLGVNPSDVSTEIAETYRTALIANEVSKDPEVSYRNTVSTWNLCVRRYAEWPQTRIERASRKFKVVRPLDEFPASFAFDLQRVLGLFAMTDPLADQLAARPLRPQTIEGYRRQLLQFASELVAANVPIETIDSVAVLCEPPIAELGLRQMLKRNGNETSSSISAMATLLHKTATTIKAPERILAGVQKLAKQLNYKVKPGMTQKNRTRLRPLQKEDAQVRLLKLPDQLFHSRTGRNLSDGVAREDAIAIALLLVCPVRIKNLSSIHLEHSLKRPAKTTAFIVFEDEETKTWQPIEFELPDDVRQMVDEHLATRSPHLCGAECPWLFPKRKKPGPIAPNQLARRIKQRIRDEVGLEMNAHLFRHFGVMLYLNENPGHYEVVRQLLGHTQLSRTISVYSGLESRSAVRLFGDVVARKRGNKP